MDNGVNANEKVAVVMISSVFSWRLRITVGTTGAFAKVLTVFLSPSTANARAIQLFPPNPFQLLMNQFTTPPAYSGHRERLDTNKGVGGRREMQLRGDYVCPKSGLQLCEFALPRRWRLREHQPLGSPSSEWDLSFSRRCPLQHYAVRVSNESHAVNFMAVE
jgi:hypothetical protein